LDLNKCKGCGQSLADTDARKNRAVAIQFGTLEGDDESPRWNNTTPRQEHTWGRMHERCFLLAIGDRRGVELAAQHAH
jgi:hypothetical protein